MDQKRGEIRNIILKIQEYQKYVILNKRLIRMLEVEGGDTVKLMKEVKWAEDKIRAFKFKSRYYL
jgi:hypothetical protein